VAVQLIRERMADVANLRRASSVELLLERQDWQQKVGVAKDLAAPPRSPCPDLRADVVDDGHALPGREPREEKVEAGRVDAEDRVGTPGRENLVETPQDARELAELADESEDHRRRPDEVRFERSGGSSERRSAESGEFDLRSSGPNRLDAVGRVLIARCLGGRNENVRHRRVESGGSRETGENRVGEET